MLEGLDIVVLSYNDWNTARSTPQHLAQLMAENNRVLFVNLPHSSLHFMRGSDPLRECEWHGPALQTIAPNLYGYHPPHLFLPVGGLPYSVARRTLLLNGRLAGRLICRQMRRLNFHHPVVWNFSPLHADAFLHIRRPRLVVHDICEEWANFLDRPMEKRLIEEMDREQARRADILFVFSPPMLRKREGLNERSYVVLPAGDVEHYSQAARPETEVPEELARLPGPVVGTICVVDPQRFDTDLITRMAKTHPDWTIVVLGPIRPETDLSPLKSFANIHMMGNRPRELLPAYLKGFDAALIPYRLNDATRDIYPMKLQEYLAAGKPVISPRLPVCAHLADVVYFSDSHDDYIANVERAMREDNPDRAAHRRNVASQNSWRQRLQERARHLEPLLQCDSTNN